MRGPLRTNNLCGMLAEIRLFHFYFRTPIDDGESRLIRQQNSNRGFGSRQTDNWWHLHKMVFLTLTHDPKKWVEIQMKVFQVARPAGTSKTSPDKRADTTKSCLEDGGWIEDLAWQFEHIFVTNTFRGLEPILTKSASTLSRPEDGDDRQRHAFVLRLFAPDPSSSRLTQ